LPSDSDEDFPCPVSCRQTIRRNAEDDSSDASDDDSDAQSSTDSATCVSSDFDCSGGEENSEDEHDGDIDPMDEQGAGVDKAMWNTPEGWKKFKKYMKHFYKEMKDFGHVCSICGERRHKCVQVAQQTLLDWYVAESYTDLLEELYPQFPKKTHEEGVRSMSY